MLKTEKTLMIFINTAGDTTGLFKPFFPITIPYGIGYLMAMLRKENLSFSFVDQQVCKNVINEVKKLVEENSSPTVFAISTLTESFSSARKISDELKALYPQSIVIMGGLHPTSMPVEVLKSVKSCDYVFAGEGETEIANIYLKLKSGQDLSDVKGVVYRVGDEIITNETSKMVKDINFLPPFPYDLFASYKRYNHGHIISSRGCPYNCTFCCVKAVGRRLYRYKSAETTVKELELLVTEFGQKEIAFFDDNFLANNNRIYDLCAEIRKSSILKGITYSFQARTRDMNENLLVEMFDTGFKAVFFGIETVSEKLLRDIGKDESILEIENAIKLAQKIGYKVMANFLFCLPSETKDVRNQCVDFTIKNKLDLAKFNNVVPYPGTVMYDQILAENKLLILPDYINFNSQEVLVRPIWKKANFPYLPEDSTAYGMKQEILFAYFRYYFRWKIILKIFTQRTWGDAIFSYGSSSLEVLKKTPSFILLLTDISFKFGLMFLSVFSKKGVRIKDLLKSISGFFK